MSAGVLCSHDFYAFTLVFRVPHKEYFRKYTCPHDSDTCALVNDFVGRFRALIKEKGSVLDLSNLASRASAYESVQCVEYAYLELYKFKMMRLASTLVTSLVSTEFYNGNVRRVRNTASFICRWMDCSLDELLYKIVAVDGRLTSRERSAKDVVGILKRAYFSS